MSTSSVKSARRSTKTARRTTEKTTKTASTAKKTAKSARAAASKAAKSARGAVAKATKATKPAKTVKSAKTAKTAKAAAKTKPAAKATPAPSLAPEFAAAAAMIRTASPPMQPVAAYEAPVRSHKYRVGETVYYTSPTFGRAAATGSYTVVRLLPSDGDEQQYRIKSSGEAFERVAKESQLDRA